MVLVPQPSVDRMAPVAGHPLVVGIVPGQPALVARTAALWATATGASRLVAAYADPARYVVEELPDGSVRHMPVDPDGVDDEWLLRQAHINQHLAAALGPSGVTWELRYLAGRADRALTHLARAVDAGGFVIGTRAPGAGARIRDWLEGSVAFRLTHHQHRPVLVVPLEVVDWQESTWH
jgi:hypothetical protein